MTAAPGDCAGAAEPDEQQDARPLSSHDGTADAVTAAARAAAGRDDVRDRRQRLFAAAEIEPAGRPAIRFGVAEKRNATWPEVSPGGVRLADRVDRRLIVGDVIEHSPNNTSRPHTPRGAMRTG
jgi:hypothetical protein